MSVSDSIPDVLIVGAGASGAAVAYTLARAGISVVCLEQGRWIDPAEYPHSKGDWEWHRFSDFHINPNVRQWPEDYPVNASESPINPVMFNAVGGSTIHWAGHFPRFRPSDFRVRTLDGVADDWPLTYAELEPYYERNDAFIGVSGLHGDPSNPPRAPRGHVPTATGAAGRVYARGLEKLGWHWWPSDGAIVTAPTSDGRPACNNCGPCFMGCPTGAMSSAHTTYWPAAVKLGARLITHARVREIAVDPRGRATGAVYYDRDGRVREQRARVVVMAGNGVGTPRLLLNSASSQFPHGLSNSSGELGRNLMFHPVAFISGIFDERVDGQGGPIGNLLHSQEFYETDLTRGFVRGFQFQLCRDMGPAGTAVGSLGAAASPVPWGADHHRGFQERFGHALTATVMGEDLPEPTNRVTLDPALTDSHGIPAPRITYTLSENSRRMLEFGSARGRELLEAAGARAVFVDPLVRDSGWHLMGTARMGDDPSRSVVDRWGRAHDVPNLFIVDGSVFVTGAAVNPTTTIQALALRTADWIRDHHREIAL